MRANILALVVVVAASACKGSAFAPPGAPALEIFPAAATLSVETDSQFVALTTGDFGGDPSVSWRSTAPAVVSVGSAGRVIAHAPGSALVIVRVSGRVTLEDTSDVTVQ